MLYFFIIFGIVIFIGFIYTLIYLKKLKKNGIETIGVVRVSIEETWDTDGVYNRHKYYYVKFKDLDNKEVEATISNPKSDLNDGDKIKIKYLSKNSKYAYFIEKIK